MHIFVRFNGHPFKEFSLREESKYSVGRKASCDIHLPFPGVSREQGSLYFDGTSWVFEDLSSSPPRIHKLTDATAAHLKNGLEIFTSEFLEQEVTHSRPSHRNHVFEWVAFSFLKRSSPTAVVFLFTLIVLAGARAWYSKTNTLYNSQTLMSYAEKKVVKFELKFNPENVKKVNDIGDFTGDDIRKNIGFCTGFIVAKNIVLTAHHCLARMPGFSLFDDFNIVTKDHRPLIPKRILGFDFVKDFLFLEVEGLTSEDESLHFAKTSEIGEKVFTIGNVAGEGLAIREGIIAGVTEDPVNPQVEYIRFSAAASPGNSGGPLLNERGEVVALVSKKNFAENYNIGIRFQDLKSGFDRFVLNQESKEIVYSSAQNDMDIPSLASLFPGLFGLKVGDAFLARKEISKKYTDFKIRFEVPFAFEQRKSNYFDVAMEEAKKLVSEIEKALSADHLPGMAWETQATKELQIVAPVAAEELKISFKKITDDLMVPTTLGLIGHSGYEGYNLALTDWKKSGNYSYPDGLLAQRVSLLERRVKSDPSHGYLVYSSIDDKNEPIDLTSFFQVSPDFAVFYLSQKSTAEKKELVKETAKRIFFAEKGAHINAKIFPFLRSKAKSHIQVSNFPEGLQFIKSISDKHGRAWDYYQANFFGAFFIELFCGDFPQTTHCLSWVREGEPTNLELSVVENFVKSEFSEKFPLIDFYLPPSLSLLGSNKDPVFKQNELDFKDQSVSAKNIFGIYSYEIKTDKKIYLVRPRSAVVFKPEGAQWTTTGFNFIQGTKEKNPKFQLCTSGLEMSPYRTNSLIYFSQSDLSRMVASLSGTAPETRSASSHFWKKSFRLPASGFMDSYSSEAYLYGSCFPLVPQQNRPDTFVVDPYKPSPLPVRVLTKNK
jgi:hypothetical protein